jgi:hypothetical protein
MNEFERIKQINNKIEINDINSVEFSKYGKVIISYDNQPLIEYLQKNTDIPIEGNVYIASVHEMESLEIYKQYRDSMFGEMDIQIGYCNGRNSTLNGLEYHKSSEVDIAATDLILLLGSIQHISNNTYDSNQVEAFFLPRGCAVELYSTTLHFAPCKTTEDGFKCLVILPRGTNEALQLKVSGKNEAELLFAKNKWLIIHPSRTQLRDKGAVVGILGDNKEIKY